MQSSALRTVIPVFCLALLWGMPLQARPRYKADGQKLTVETDRYRVDVDGLAVTQSRTA